MSYIAVYTDHLERHRSAADLLAKPILHSIASGGASGPSIYPSSYKERVEPAVPYSEAWEQRVEGLIALIPF